MKLSVIICTHNPREDFLRRVLEGLKKQSLPRNLWELLLIDNASSLCISDAWDLSWHPNARHINESRLGLTSARLRGIDESIGQVLVFVDDDNILEADYLQKVLEIHSRYPIFGAWGGEQIAEFESSFPKELEGYLNRLAISSVSRLLYSTEYFRYECLPAGAGICIIREVALYYKDNVNKSKLRMALDRKGNSLASCGDMDMAMTAIDLGFAVARCPELKLTHIIAKNRLTINYMARLVKSDACSNVLLRHLRGAPLAKRGRFAILRKLWLRLRISRVDYLMFCAATAGECEGLRIIR